MSARVGQRAARTYCCEQCGEPGAHKPVVTGRGGTGSPSGPSRPGGGLRDTWAYAWLCPECAAPYERRRP